MTKLKSKLLKVGAVVSSGALAVSANAASILPTSFSTDAADVKADMMIVGGIVLGLVVVRFGFQWVKKTFA